MNFNCKWNFSKITPLRIAILYGLTSWIWILFSDGLIALIISNQQELLKFSTLKGGLFVLVTAILLYFLIQSGYSSLQKSEQALKKEWAALERYRLLADEVQDIIIFISPEGQIIDANEAAVKRYGYTRQELTNMPVNKLRLPEDQLTVPCFLQNAPKGMQFELKHVCKDGSVFPIDVSAKGATSNGKPIIISLIRDISERKKVEAEVWLEKERAQVTLESIGDAVITTDVQAKIEYFNPVAEALTGWSKKEAIGLSLEKIFKIINEETGESVESPVARSLREGRVVSIADQTVLINKLGNTVSIEDSAAPIRDRDDTIIGAVLVFRDVSYKRNHMKELAHQAQHDALTGLPNRFLFNEHLKQALARAKRKEGKVAVMFLDLDRFKLINDTMGHNLGDQLLKSVAERIHQTLREGDTVARQGGDEFLVILSEIKDEMEAKSVSERILGVFSKPIILEDNEIYISTSIGISLYPDDSIDRETLVKQADTAMYYAKERGRNNCQFFTPGLNIKANQRLSTENSLRKALIREEFVLHYQPQVNLDTGHIVGLEALLRWNSVEFGLVSPAAFIPVAEETGLIIPIGEWVLRTACAQNKDWQDQGFIPLRIAVNISARQFQEPGFIKLVKQVLQETKLDPQWLELEITERIAMEKGEITLKMLAAFKELGIRISIDDFGTGFSSLNYLSRMPIDTLKIDQTFIQDISSGDNGKEVVTAIIQLAKNLQLKVIAEGVETNNQCSFLKDKLCDEMQGYLFSKAVPSEEAEKLFERLAK
ncbi:sensor domain-containing protein [Desulfosporosinus lacus]|uniref:PAS domain S-box-containing protein/diguanylate cyclase (GGDEF) domain-containing protein n=1 Tax=Desulfosporosinus lacus DSM 15449 TaxID=1121420 RepID=A0A1M5YZQ4_9FIRM|nr:EAL domain-containing protein [Desulfosporosinus lacus]SHI17414.1 PAS domain S-box-containing protein/diguanylate cyclase (GGDEF) domain-containing protein [Desulfosporosinus lacus DSM 15449]